MSVRPEVSSGVQWQVQVGPDQWVSLREVMQSVSAPDDPLYRKVLAAMIDPQQTREAHVRRYFWGLALRHGDAGLILDMAQVAVAGGETDAVILGELANRVPVGRDGQSAPLLPGTPFQGLPETMESPAPVQPELATGGLTRAPQDQLNIDNFSRL